MLCRGVKKEANLLSLGVRREQDLAKDDPLDPWQLADHLGIPVIPISELAGVPMHSAA